MEKHNFPPGFPSPGRLLPSPSSTTSFSNDLSQMPDNPPKNSGHRRAQSEVLTLPDDVSFESDLGVVGVSDETDDDLFSMYIDMDKVNAETSEFQVGEGSGDAAEPRARHQYSQSMDETVSMAVGGGEGVSPAEARKAISAAKLAELARVDPKRAKRIMANRQSAARSKERKMRYIAELERKVQTLRTEATSLSAELALLQRDTNGLAVENNELKLRLQTMEQQVILQDTLNETLRDEIQHLKMLTGQAMANIGPTMNFPTTSFAGNPPIHPNNQAMHTLLTAQQLQQLQIHSQKQPHQFQHHQLHQLLQQQDPALAQHSGDIKMRPTSESDSGTSKN